MDEETSIFIQKYREILKFKSQSMKKKININKYNAKTDNSADIRKKISINLPNIVRKNSTSQINSKDNLKKSKNKNQSFRQPNKNKKNILDIYNIVDKVKTNVKPYKQFIMEHSDISPKKNIKVINEAFYKRLLKKTNKFDSLNNSADDTKINHTNEDNNNKQNIKLPFLINIKSRYINCNGKNKKISLNKSCIVPESEKIHTIKKSKSNYKGTNLNKLLKKKEMKYFYLILPGNNSKLVEKCLLTRPNWEKIGDTNNLSLCHLIWTPLSQEINFSLHGETSLSQIVNHFECHSELSNKKNLFINLLRYCEYNRINLFSFYPLTIILNFKQEYFKEQIEGFKQLYYDISTLIETENKDNEKQKNYSDYFRVNLVKRVGSMQKIIIPKSNYIGKNLWLLKRINLNRGREIKVISDISNLLNEIELSKKENKYNYLIIQKYIEDPLLYKMRKFDIRIWVLFSYVSKNYQFEVYAFKEGHLKACSETFNLHSDDLYVHLTNYSVQKYNKNFSKIEIGNEISFETFQKELDKRSIKKNFKKDVFPKIMKIIAYSANASKSKINILSRNNCFEIFGYDFILDKNFQPFLLEINTNPGLEESSPLIEMLVPRMIDDAFRLTIDQIFERDDENKNISKFKVEGYSDEENLWQYINLKI